MDISPLSQAGKVETMTEEQFIEAAVEFIQWGDPLVMLDNWEQPDYYLEFHSGSGRITMTAATFRRVLGRVREHCEHSREQDQLIWKWRG